MTKKIANWTLIALSMLIFLAVTGPADAAQRFSTTILPSTIACGQCHSGVMGGSQWLTWSTSTHSNTQSDVASELAEERAGQSAEEAINGSDAEDCISCHGPTAVLANGGMTEAQALAYFFTTKNGVFDASTAPTNTSEWPSIACTACHDASSGGHPSGLNLALFSSHDVDSSGKHVEKRVATSSELCGQCHGSLQPQNIGTDHLTYNGWKSSKHSNTQSDVADELAEERAGQSPSEVVNGSDPEDCIACHAPTAVRAHGGMTDTQALEYFFTANGGAFDSSTVPQHADEWPHVACIVCHDPHHPDNNLSFFNSITRRRQPMPSAEVLCGQCHGNLLFPGTDHLSYNIEQGTGGIGVPNQVTMPGVTCIDCHMHIVDDGFNGHRWGHLNGCQKCHGLNAGAAQAKIDQYKSDFAALDEETTSNVEAAVDAMNGVQNPSLQAKLDEAQANLDFAHGDESGGFHNHKYTMALLNDANEKAKAILATKP